MCVINKKGITDANWLYRFDSCPDYKSESCVSVSVHSTTILGGDKGFGILYTVINFFKYSQVAEW